MSEPGDVVVINFPGAQVSKKRPAVIVSSSDYHAQRPDAILGFLQQISRRPQNQRTIFFKIGAEQGWRNLLHFAPF